MPLVFARDHDDFERLTTTVINDHDGGHVSFTGTVRKINKNKEVIFLFYEAYESLALKQFGDLEQEAHKRFNAGSIKAVHRLGKTFIAEPAVFIQASAVHRHEAFLAARFLIDELKKSVAIWKEEHYRDGSSAWDQGSCQCDISSPLHNLALGPLKKAFKNSGQSDALEKLQNTHVLLIGAGGLGCPVALNLGALGLRNLSIYDADIINESNLARQFAYTLADKGKYKAQVLKNFLEERFSWLRISAFTEFFNLNYAQKLGQFDLIIDSSDCMKTKIISARLSQKLGKNYICASVYSNEGEVTTISAKALGGCFCCWRQSSIQPLTCADSGVFTHSCAQVAAYACAQAKKLLCTPDLIFNNELALINSHSIQKINLSADPHCSSCASSSSMLKIIKQD